MASNGGIGNVASCEIVPAAKSGKAKDEKSTDPSAHVKIAKENATAKKPDRNANESGIDRAPRNGLNAKESANVRAQKNALNANENEKEKAIGTVNGKSGTENARKKKPLKLEPLKQNPPPSGEIAKNNE